MSNAKEKLALTPKLVHRLGVHGEGNFKALSPDQSQHPGDPVHLGHPVVILQVPKYIVRIDKLSTHLAADRSLTVLA